MYTTDPKATAETRRQKVIANKPKKGADNAIIKIDQSKEKNEKIERNKGNRWDKFFKNSKIVDVHHKNQ